MSWVIPDVRWSDHPGPDGSVGSKGWGPYYVADIVNEIGQSTCTDPNYPNDPFWKHVAIFITWDDWGGFYDHVTPFSTTGAGNQGWGEAYTYGFRVPLLVVSAYTGTYQNPNWSGYISGALPPYGPGEVQPYVHDFGSILNFIEYAFGQNGQSIAPPGGIYPSYPYADWYAPDGPNTSTCSPTVCPWSLHDFFQNGFTNSRTFTPLTQGINYKTQCFITPGIGGCFGLNFTASDPDADAVDPD